MSIYIVQRQKISNALNTQGLIIKTNNYTTICVCVSHTETPRPTILKFEST